ncbi:Aldo/keto reductase [Echria macrotheca]|uniref:Aldo/keto reductase n=1 Tax=Echria macrotheca TaxID=438768 RepID=A0AAJ0B609_9PEZI|nr:Aldo/keto reductase [Echria macrotheca]
MSSPIIPLRKLGKNGPLVPAIGYGMMGLSYTVYGAFPSDEERFAILDRAHELGARFWDSSDLYGDSEELIGRWFKRTGKRDDIFLATKFGYVKGAAGYNEIDSSYAYTKKACEESLRVLGIDYIDLYYVHQMNPKTPIEETMKALAELQAEGKIKHIGLSGPSSTTLRRAAKIAPVTAVQTDYSPFVRDIESASGTNLLAACRELGVAVVAAMPLGRGMVTSTFALGDTTAFADARAAMMPRFSAENMARNAELVKKFGEIAETKKGCTSAQLAIAWLLKQGGDIFPIPGTKKMKYLEENCEAAGVELTDQEEREIRAFLEGVEVAGDTVPEAYKGHLYVDTVEA